MINRWVGLDGGGRGDGNAECIEVNVHKVRGDLYLCERRKEDSRGRLEKLCLSKGRRWRRSKCVVLKGLGVKVKRAGRRENRRMEIRWNDKE